MPWKDGCSGQAGLAASSLPPSCRQSVVHALLPCGGGAPAYFTPALAPLSLRPAPRSFDKQGDRAGCDPRVAVACDPCSNGPPCRQPKRRPVRIAWPVSRQAGKGRRSGSLQLHELTIAATRRSHRADEAAVAEVDARGLRDAGGKGHGHSEGKTKGKGAGKGKAE